jgi:ankyrin repeat protein
MRTTTPLQAAAINGLTDVLKPLLDAGADPNVRNEVSFAGIDFNHTIVMVYTYGCNIKYVSIVHP